MSSPKVSVVMPVYNGEKYVGAAISSILNQDFKDFELLVLDDGSVDASVKVISSFTDKRIRFVQNERNIGLISTLNKALKLVDSEYIVRMDGDDIAHGNRLSTQVKFMDENREVGASGSFYHAMLGDKKMYFDLPVSHDEIKCFLLFNCPLAHPTSIIRTSVLKKNNISYSADFVNSEDYDFWSQISLVSKVVNIPQSLLDYRMHENQITGNPKHLAARNASVNAIRMRHIAELKLSFNDEEMRIHNLVSDGLKPSSLSDIEAANLWFVKMLKWNQERVLLHHGFLQKIIFERMLRFYINFYGVKGVLKFHRSELYNTIKLPLRHKIELFKNIFYSWKRKQIKK